jgi:hypothetical protein
MKSARLTVLTAAAVAAAGLAAVAVPGAASAAANITITSAGPTGSNPYVLTVVADDGTGLTLSSLTAVIDSGSTPVYTVGNLQPVAGGTPAAQTWTAAAPIPQADLPPGTYTVTVNAKDADETDNGLMAPGSFTFSWTTSVTAKASPSVLSYNETTTTISGTVTGTVPGSSYTTPVDLSGVPVYVNYVNGDNGPWDAEIGTTGTDGMFSGSVDLPAADGEYTVSVNQTPTMNSGGTSLTTSWASDNVRLEGVSVTPQNFTYGQNGVATLSGTVQYQDSVTGWQPLASAQVVVIAGSYDVKYIDTNAQGQFTWTFVPDTDGTGWSVETGGGNLLGVAQASGSVNDAVPLSFKSFTASLSPFAELSVSACVQVNATGFLSPQGYLDVQYSARPGGPWKYLGRVKYQQVNEPSSCGVNTQSYFKGTLPVKLANAYYRAEIPASPSYQLAASKALHESKYLTRIISVHVSPSSVGHGGRITVSGRLQQDKGRWSNFGRQLVLIVLKPKGSKVWYWIHKVRTSASGHFSATFTDPVTADWSAAYDGGKADFASSGSIHYVRVSGASRALRLSPAVLGLIARDLARLPQ